MFATLKMFWLVISVKYTLQDNLASLLNQNHKIVLLILQMKMNFFVYYILYKL